MIDLLFLILFLILNLNQGRNLLLLWYYHLLNRLIHLFPLLFLVSRSAFIARFRIKFTLIHILLFLILFRQLNSIPQDGIGDEAPLARDPCLSHLVVQALLLGPLPLDANQWIRWLLRYQTAVFDELFLKIQLLFLSNLLCRSKVKQVFGATSSPFWTDSFEWWVGSFLVFLKFGGLTRNNSGDILYLVNEYVEVVAALCCGLSLNS